MARIKTFAAGGSYAAADFNAIQDDYEALHGYQRLVTRVGRLTSVTGTTQVTLNGYEDATASAGALLTSAFYYDPAERNLGSPAYVTRAPKLRLAAVLYTAATAPNTTFHFDMFNVGTWTSSGAAAAGATQVGGYDGSSAFPAAGVAQTIDSGDLAAPVAGWYAIFARAEAAPAAGSFTFLQVDVWERAA